MFTESPRLKARTFLVADTPSNALHIPALSIYMRGIHCRAADR